MVLDLRNIPSVIVNLPQHSQRRDHMKGLMTGLGMPHRFVSGVTKFGKKKNVAAAHAAAFDTMEAAPFIVFEDDQELLWDDCVLPDPPQDADVIYLANSQLGCLPDTAEYKAKYRMNAYPGLALAEAHDAHYLRLYSMISAMAILILSERGRARYRLELKKAFNRDIPIDVRYAFAMPDLRVYALRSPMFAEAPDLQVAAKQGNARYDETHLPLPVAREGDIRIARHRHRKLVVQAVRDPQSASLNWHVQQAVGPQDMLAPITQPRLRLPNYNQDILKDRLELIENAKVFPPDPETDSCGVTDEIGRFCPLSAEYRRIKRRMRVPEPARHDEPIARLSGTYVYGGWLHPHFGHFLAESTVRLWALGEDHGPIDGVIFIPYGPKTIWRTRKTYMPILQLLAGDVPIIPQVSPAIVDRLIVAEPGFGHQDRMMGSRKYIDFMRGRVAGQIAPEGPERLYISRSYLSHKRGGIFGERALEDYLTTQGYTIFHPQQHSAAEQLARYRAAREIISLDGSPLHFAAFAVNSDARVAIIKRRISDIPEKMAAHITRFSGADVTVIDAIKDMWVNEGKQRIDYSAYGHLDLVAVTRALGDAGFCRTDAAMPPFTQSDIAAELDRRPEDAPHMVPFRPS